MPCAHLYLFSDACPSDWLVDGHDDGWHTIVNLVFQSDIASYNHRIGGIEGRGIGFEEFVDRKGRHQMKHSFVNFHGYHEIQGPYHQMLVLLFMASFVADQFTFFFRDIVTSHRYGFDDLRMTVVSDKLSGDDDLRSKSELNLRHLIDPENEHLPLALTSSSKSDVFSADLIVDNLAGWMTAAISDPNSSLAGHARELISSGVWAGWHQLQPSTSELIAVPAVDRLQNARSA